MATYLESATTFLSEKVLEQINLLELQKNTFPSTDKLALAVVRPTTLAFDILNYLSNEYLYFSPSEILRNAIRFFIINYNNNYKSDLFQSSDYEHFTGINQKEHLMTKISTLLKKQIDNIKYVNKSFSTISDAIRSALFEYINYYECFHKKLSLFIPKKAKQVYIALNSDILKYLEYLVTYKYYMSVAEIIRIACIDFSVLLLHQKKYYYQSIPKKTVTPYNIKMSMRFLTIIDIIYEEYDFDDRTEFVHSALDYFLRTESLLQLKRSDS